MKCIVTAGPTYEPLDAVRRLTNFSTGSLGCELAAFLSGKGHDVTLLVGEQATYKGERRAAVVQQFTTTGDLRAHLEALKTNDRIAIFHAAAVSDFAFGKIFSKTAAGDLVPETARKISTRSGSLFAELLPTPKILAELRGGFQEAVIIGWKYEADGGRADCVAKGREQVAACKTNGCVVNGPAYGDGFGLLSANGDIRHLTSRGDLLAALGALVA